MGGGGSFSRRWLFDLQVFEQIKIIREKDKSSIMSKSQRVRPPPL